MKAPAYPLLNSNNQTNSLQELSFIILRGVCESQYRHIRNYYLSNSKTFQDGNGNGNFEEINSNDFLDGNWESMEIKGRLRGPRR